MEKPKKKDKSKKKSESSNQISATIPEESRQKKEEKEEMLRLMYGFRHQIDEKDEEIKKEHKFWDSQPVPKIDEKSDPESHGPIDIIKQPLDVKQEPYNLPKGFEWSDCDLNDDKTVDEIYNLLTNNYVEDDECMFRFDYSKEFLRWALLPPGYYPDLHVGVRVSNNRKLVGFITGIPSHVQVHSTAMPMVEINFLCVYKKLRANRLAPVLIKEITRRVNKRNIWQAVYTAGVVIPKPIARNRYYHRSLNPKKLIDIGFSRLHPRVTLNATLRLYRVPAETITVGIREMQPKDVAGVTSLLNNYLSRFKLFVIFTQEEVAHILLPRENVIHSFVVEDQVSGSITDLISFYQLPSNIIKSPKYSKLIAAYSYYNVSNKTPWNKLMTDALVLAKQRNFDVFNALNVMENEKFLHDLKFGIGDGQLQYYIYNWRCPELLPKEVGIVLL